MSKPFMLDTDVLVDFLRGRPAAVLFVLKNAERILVPAVVVTELFAGVRGEAEEKTLDELLGFLQVIPITASMARQAGLLKRQYGPSHGVGLADALIAAAAEADDADLKTLNLKHFPMFKGLRAPYAKK